MPQLDFNGALSKVSCDKLASQSGTTVELTAGHKITNFASTGIDDNAAGATAIVISADEEVTMPLQPAFSVKLDAADQNNIAVGSDVTILFDSEVFDVNADFNTGTYTFTAPVTGKYQLNADVRFIDIDSAADFYYMGIVTSNRTYTHTIFDPDFGQDAAHWSLSFSVLADMDASDTAYVVIYQGGGTQQTDITAESIFSGYLAC